MYAYIEGISDLLEESDELAGAPFVRFGEIEVLQEENESLTVSRSVHTTSVSRYHHTHLQTYKEGERHVARCSPH